MATAEDQEEVDDPTRNIENNKVLWIPSSSSSSSQRRNRNSSSNDNDNDIDIDSSSSSCISFPDVCDGRKSILSRFINDDNNNNANNANNNDDDDDRGEDDDDACSSTTTSLGFVLLYASWNTNTTNNCRGGSQSQQSQRHYDFVMDLATKFTHGLVFAGGGGCRAYATSIQIDDSKDDDDDDTSLSLYIGDNNNDNDNDSKNNSPPIPPGELPCLAVTYQTSDMERADIRYVKGVKSADITDALNKNSSRTRRNINNSNSNNNNALPNQTVIYKGVRRTITSIEDEYDLPVAGTSCNEAIRIFVAGDRSSVGKSSVCLGIIGSLLKQKSGGPSSYAYAPHQLAYIKPATQSESAQLIERYCSKHGIDCRPIGPLVYYRGFTRAYLANETPTSRELLDSCANAVDRLCRNKKVVLIDGVGFPAVGSICGTDNASVAKACSYPMFSGMDSQSHKQQQQQQQQRKPMGVVLVGGTGVGAAVDAFNLNATYFEHANVPVMGAIFNKLSEGDSFYSLENCKREVTRYFEQSDNQSRRKAFGFVPLYPDIAKKGEEGMKYVDDFIRIFGERVDVTAILDAAEAIKNDDSAHIIPSTTIAEKRNGDEHQVQKNKNKNFPPKKRRKIDTQQHFRARDAIEKEAILAGAAPSA